MSQHAAGEVYAVGALHSWTQSVVVSGAPAYGVTADESLGIGFLPVFASREEAERHAGGRPIIVLRTDGHSTQDTQAMNLREKK